MPEFKMPAMPEIPSLPGSFKFPEMQLPGSFEMPELPGNFEMPELPSAFGGLKMPVIPGTQIRTAEKPTTPPTRVPVPEVKSEAIKAVIAAVDKEIAAISNEAKRSNAKKNRDRTILSRLNAKDRKEYSQMTEDALRSKKAVMNMNPAAKDPTPDTFVGIEASGDFSNLARESDILANIEAEKAASAKATRDKRQKAAAADAAKVQAELKKQTMASAKSMKAGLDAGKSEKKAVKEPKVVPAAKPAAAAPKPTPVVAAAPVVVANDKNAEEAQAWIDAWKSNGSKKTTAAAESSSDSNNINDEGADEAQAWIDAWKAKQ
jgi:hypothetical protein